VHDGRENAELRHPETARPQDIVIERRHRATDHFAAWCRHTATGVAARPKPHRGGSRAAAGEPELITCVYILQGVFYESKLAIGGRLKGNEELIDGVRDDAKLFGRARR